ncbi:hypothetical protein PAXINDRAFT_11011 [Paxillus involutus ATCC 200175]|nr:hypothetical protein PAXINDRAFT_11011 [Paxillus involutus ATCC 200175]
MRNGTCCTREDDVEGNQGKVESRSRGDREPDDEDGDNIDVDHAHVVPHPPSLTGQTANEEATGTSNPNANGAGTTMPVGTSNGPSNASKLNGNDEGVEGKGEKGEGNERASGIPAPSSNGEYTVPDLIPPVPNPHKQTPPPPSTPLEGEKDGEELSGHVDKAGTHDEPPRHELKTTPPTQTPQWVRKTRRLGGEARDEAKEDEEGQQNRERGRTTEERRMAATIANVNGQYTTTEAGDLPPEPPPFPHHPALPPPPPIHPERQHDVNTVKSNRTAARPRRRNGHTRKPAPERTAQGGEG